MNFTEAVKEVLAIVKRPDKIGDIRREVNSALNWCCIETEFARDLIEATVPVDPNVYVQSLALDMFTRFRKFEYLKAPTAKCTLASIAPNAVFTNGREAINSYYIAGNSVVLKTASLQNSMQAGWFAYPPTLTDTNPNYWLLETSPYMIIDRAASKVLTNIGDDASASRHMNQFTVAYLSARRDLAYGTKP